MKIKFNSDDDFPKRLKFMSLTIIVRTFFGEDGKYYPQMILNDCLYEL